MYRRVFRGMIERGKTSEFLIAMRSNIEHQDERGIRARTAIWAAMTGQTNEVFIATDFNTLDDLERYTELAAKDSSFADVRRAVRSLMVYHGSSVLIQRLSFHSEGLISAEEATAPRHFRRTLSGETLPGMQRQFVHSIAQALEFQRQRGVDATTSVWTSLTGSTNAISIDAEFDTLGELQKFDDMAATDSDFAALRRATREAMEFHTTSVQLLRNLA